MKPIQKDELYQHLSGFLKAKGIELKDGSYSGSIQKGCSILADAINISQNGLQRAKVGIDKNLDRLRQTIHEKTAPKSKPKSQAAKPKAAAGKSRGKTPKSSGAKRKGAKS